MAAFFLKMPCDYCDFAGEKATPVTLGRRAFEVAPVQTPRMHPALWACRAQHGGLGPVA